MILCLSIRFDWNPFAELKRGAQLILLCWFVYINVYKKIENNHYIMTWLTNTEDTHALSPIHFNGKCTILIRLQIITSVRKMLYERNGCEWLACRYVPFETQTLKSVQFLLRPCYVLATPWDQWGTDGVPMRYQWTDSEGSLTCTLGQNGPKIVVERTGERERETASGSSKIIKRFHVVVFSCFFLQWWWRWCFPQLFHRASITRENTKGESLSVSDLNILPPPAQISTHLSIH